MKNQLNRKEMTLISKVRDPVNRLGMTVMLKHLQINAGFPAHTKDVAANLVSSLAEELRAKRRCNAG